ncbi:CHAP domain-containing protein [Amycolatopsis anabasis]|uniref:CHAP domain-containing protein n=1 Tax=Amycolatopsis anabasis TaxID=1840409 RepID=UPI00131E7CB5|nr:CHAP domain-containing protein [Amycolatopsis anabasis]
MRSTKPKKAATLFAALVTACLAVLTVPADASPRAADVRSEIARHAKGEVGQGETPPGSNCNPYGPCESWCAHFATWTWRKAGIDIPNYGFTGDIYTWGKKRDRAHGTDTGMRVGDIVLYGTGPGNVDTGVVVAVSDGKITTVEGNSGDKVARHGPFDPRHAKAAGRPADIYGWVSAA